MVETFFGNYRSHSHQYDIDWKFHVRSKWNFHFVMWPINWETFGKNLSSMANISKKLSLIFRFCKAYHSIFFTLKCSNFNTLYNKMNSINNTDLIKRSCYPSACHQWNQRGSARQGSSPARIDLITNQIIKFRGSAIL